MPYLVWKNENCSLVSYKYVSEDEIVLQKTILENKFVVQKPIVKVVDEAPIKINNEWYIDGEKCFEPEYARLEREYEKIMETLDSYDDFMNMKNCFDL